MGILFDSATFSAGGCRNLSDIFTRNPCSGGNFGMSRSNGAASAPHAGRRLTQSPVCLMQSS